MYCYRKSAMLTNQMVAFSLYEYINNNKYCSLASVTEWRIKSQKGKEVNSR